MNMTADYISYLVESYSDTIVRICYTYLKNKSDAEDVCQDVFLKIIDKSPEFEDKKHEKAYLIKTAVNMCKNKLTSFWNKNKCSEDNIPESGAYDNYKDDTVINAVLSLPEKYRITVYMFYYEGYSTLEISKIIGKSDAAVRSYLHRAREKLKTVLKEEYDFEQKI